MVATVSAWAKPGAWALEAEEPDAAIMMGKDDEHLSEVEPQQQDFPSLTTAAASKASKKKKKAQPISLAEFTTGKPVSHGAAGRVAFSASKGLTADEILQLPTGPRERSAEELERSSSRGFGYSYGSRGRGAGEESNPSRWGSSRDSDEPRRGGFGGSGGGPNRDMEPSRADEIDDWGAAKKIIVPERRERGGGGGGFFDSQSRADESDSWISNKSAAPPADGRRTGGFGASRERMGGFEMFNKEGSNGGRNDSETWGRKKDLNDSETSWKREEGMSSGGRRRLVLQPRSVPLSNGNNAESVHAEQDKVSTEKKSRGSNPFGAARPREEVLAEKGQDWKKIDEKLEAVKIHDVPSDRSSFGKKGSPVANGNGGPLESRTDRAWRKPHIAESSSFWADKAENTVSEK